MFVLLLPFSAFSSLYFAHYLSDLDNYEIGIAWRLRPPAAPGWHAYGGGAVLCLLWEYSIFKLTIFPAAARRSRAAEPSPRWLVTVSNLCLGWLLAAGWPGPTSISSPPALPITHTTKENCDNIRTEKYFFPKCISNKWFYFNLDL